MFLDEIEKELRKEKEAEEELRRSVLDAVLG